MRSWEVYGFRKQNICIYGRVSECPYEWRSFIELLILNGLRPKNVWTVSYGDVWLIMIIE